MGKDKRKRKRRITASIAIVAIVAAIVSAVLGLTSFIDKKLNQSAEQQVVTFTEQSASNVTDRMYMSQNAIGAFTVQTTDPALVAPALSSFQEHHGFANATFAGMDGRGVRADGSAFSVDELAQPETALSEGRSSYSATFANEAGARVRLAQTPLYIDGQQVGALYVQVPLSLFSMSRQLDMFDGRGYFMLFEGSTGEVLVPPTGETKTPVFIGTSLYDFLDRASQYSEPASNTDAAVSTEAALQFMQSRSRSDLSTLRDVVANKQTGLLTATVDGKSSYVCVAPVDNGYWYVCNVVPVENVRAEAAVVTTTFEAVFAIIFACLVVVALLVFGAYRRRLREQNVAMLGQLYEALSDSIDMAVNLYSPTDGKVTPIVAKAERIIGYRLDAFLQNERLAATIGLSPEGVALFDRIRKDETKGFEQGEFSFRSKQTGKECWASYSVKRLTFEDKPQLLVVMRDVTADKEIQLSMKDAMDVAEAANAAKSEFLSRMSHEIRTPMNVILGTLQLARSNPDDREKVAETLKKIGDASDHLLGLINDVLDISKIENGKMTLASEPFRLSAVLSHVASAVRVQCEQRAQEFVVTTPPCADAVFVGDARRIKQLLLNLLTNAVKYTPCGGCVRFETTVAKGAAMGYRQVKFTVSDNGIGMSEEFKEYIFEPFSMEGRSREQGTGLGMRGRRGGRCAAPRTRCCERGGAAIPRRARSAGEPSRFGLRSPYAGRAACARPHRVRGAARSAGRRQRPQRRDSLRTAGGSGAGSGASGGRSRGVRHVRGVEDRLLRRGSHGCADAQHERLRGHAVHPRARSRRCGCRAHHRDVGQRLRRRRERLVGQRHERASVEAHRHAPRAGHPHQVRAKAL